MTRPSHPRWWVALAVTITGAALVSTVPAHAVSGGTATDAGVQPFLATIDVGDGASCSGALVAPEWLASSAACFAAAPSQPDIPEAGAPHTATTATIGDQARRVDRIVPREDRDLVMAHLDAPVRGVPHVALAGSAPQAGQTVQASGHGRTADRWIPGQAHTGEFTVESVTTGTLNLQGATDGTSICKGDAGGPVLHNGRLVAVASGSHQAGCMGETSEQTGATAARVDDAGDWMAAEVVDLHAGPATKNAINLTWTAMTTQYRVYGSQTPTMAIAPENLLGETTQNRYTHTSLPAGQTWYYRVAVIDDAGNEVAVSNTAQAESPTATETDFNGDGRDDIATFNGPTTSVAVSDGDQFGAASQWSTNLAGDGAIPLSGDFNGDGNSDIVTFNDGPVNVALSDGNSFGTTELWHDDFGLADQKLATGDVNGDGRDDILAFQGGEYADVFVALSEGDRFQIGADLWHDQFAADNATPATGDFNGDGRDDIVAFTDSGQVQAALSNGTGFGRAAQWHTYFAPEGEIPAVGDFNGDGKDDIATFLRGDDGYVYVSLSTGEHFVDDDQLWSDFFSTTDQWPGVGDFNGDGKSDIVTFTRGGAAQVYVARSDGAAFEDRTQWHGDFAPSPEVPLPTAHR